MQGTKTPNGYAAVAKTSGSAEAFVLIPERTRLIEIWSTTTGFQVGVSNAETDMLGSTANAIFVPAGLAGPITIGVNAQANSISSSLTTPVQAREFTYLHYILGAAANGTITINFFR